jgi:methylated-DNA-[protein]-cysteine S-methyltransferase
VVAVAIVETRYTVPGWGAGEIWQRRGLVLAHDFRFDRAVAEGPDTRDVSSQEASIVELVGRFRAFLSGEDVSFSDVSIELEWATPLQRALVEALRAVPRGEVVSYGELAALAGRPRAPRAAGAVCAGNRFSFIVPCHRVVGADGIGSYGAVGIDVKRRLLALEGVVL